MGSFKAQTVLPYDRGFKPVGHRPEGRIDKGYKGVTEHAESV